MAVSPAIATQFAPTPSQRSRCWVIDVAPGQLGLDRQADRPGDQPDGGQQLRHDAFLTRL